MILFVNHKINHKNNQSTAQKSRQIYKNRPQWRAHTQTPGRNGRHIHKHRAAFAGIYANTGPQWQAHTQTPGRNGRHIRKHRPHLQVLHQSQKNKARQQLTNRSKSN